ncbi:MAG TPA: condensation domain-containing protein, partial [Candidatus Dormibacteraeota bacterium]|nr:condensation domain-containing protein [Candidatus Dormibacteraeota bacterium]
MEQDNRSRLKQWLETGEARLQPLGFPQRELWETSPVAVADPANHICGFVELKGGITFKEAETALQRVAERQEAMRISFLPGKERALQMIRASCAASLAYRELSSAETQPEALEELMREFYRLPFDLLHGPLYRTYMLRRAANDHVLVFSIHHAIADGWSLGVFVQDLCTAYVMGLSGLRKAVAVGVMGLSNTLPPVTQTYTEWAAAERAFWQPAELSRRSVFWKSQLEGSSRLFSGSRGKSASAASLERWVSSVPGDLTSAVREVALDASTTLFSTLLAAFQLTLSKWTGKMDVLVGTPVANRNKECTRQTMGYFAGVVPLRGRIDPGQTFFDQLRGVHETAVNSFASAMPFAELASVLGEARTPGEHSVFDVRFALQNHLVPDVALPRLSTKLRMRSTGTARFDLGCEITEFGAGLEVVWLFRRDMFAAADITELNSLFLAVLT